MSPKNKIAVAPILESSPFEMVGRTKALSAQDEAFLQEREEVIRRGYMTFLEVGRALLEIRDYCHGTLYKESYGTFEQYCKERWEFGRSYAYRLIGAAEIVGELSPMGDKSGIPMPTNERQIRALATLKDTNARREAWAKACESSSNGEITSTAVMKAVRERLEAGALKREPERSTSKPRPEKVEVPVDALSEIRRRLKRIRAIAKGAQDIVNLVKEVEELLPQVKL